MMRTLRLGLGIFSLSSLTGSCLEKLPEHVDVQPNFTGESWTWSIRTDNGAKNPNEVYLPLRDLESSQGERFVRPEGERWDFMGTEAGEPVWILPQSDFGYTWPGFENVQSGVFASYVETDPRAAGISQPWIRIMLAGVEGPGEFALYVVQGASVVEWMSSADLISEEDTYFLASPGHDHTNWSFTEKGVYRISLKAVAYLGPGATNPTPDTEAVDLFFSVGARADWRASNFAADEVMNELVAGDGADADDDQIENLLEYAFGTNPRLASGLNVDTGESAGPELVMVEDGGTTYPALRFFQRIHEDADVNYEVEWNDALTGDWTVGGVEYEFEDFGDDWERVTIRDTRSVQNSRFGRVRVTVPE